MKLKVYQLDPITASDYVGWKTKVGFDRVSPCQYNLVWEGVCQDGLTLEQIAEYLRCPSFPGFTGWSLHANDLVEIDGKLHRCVDDDWEYLELAVADDAEGVDMSHAANNIGRIYGVMVHPQEKACIQELDLDQENIKKLFGHQPQVLQLPTGEFIIAERDIFEFHLDPSQNNRIIVNRDGEPITLVRGRIFFCNVNVSNDGQYHMLSLSPEKMNELAYRYLMPEKFYSTKDGIRSVKDYTRIMFAEEEI